MGIGPFRCGTMVLVDSSTPFYRDYQWYIQPYLRHFGAPFRELDLSGPADIDFSRYALLLIAHKNIRPAVTRTGTADRIAGAVKEGAGLLCFDRSFFGQNSGLFDVKVGESAGEPGADVLRFGEQAHYITSLHTGGEIKLFREINLKNPVVFQNGVILASAGGQPLLCAGKYGEGRMVLWNDYSWMSHLVRGPVYGLDDLFWRGMVWAARKPFVMQGMPPIVTMRVDDVWGSLKSGRADNPLYWIENCRSHGLKPWLGVFLDNISRHSARILKQHADRGDVTVFPHAFAGHEIPAGETPESDIPLPEKWIYFDHHQKKDYTDDVMREHVRRTEEWYGRYGIPISRVALGHYYEIGRNALKYLLKWGCDFTGVHMPPGEPYFTGVPEGEWLMGGPYRLFETGSRSGRHPVYYADYLRIPGEPQFDDRFFNCVIEIRDDAGYEWAPDNNVEETVARGIRQLARSFDSMTLAALFTHESDYIQWIAPSNWARIIDGVCRGISRRNPVYLSTDEAYRYVRAKHHLTISDAFFDSRLLRLKLEGRNDSATKCHLFTETAQGEILAELIDLPVVQGKAEISLKLR
ncbi:MAG: hypothetical protein ACM3WV_09335 [Bacillota bacterium]